MPGERALEPLQRPHRRGPLAAEEQVQQRHEEPDAEPLEEHHEERAREHGRQQERLPHEIRAEEREDLPEFGELLEPGLHRVACSINPRRRTRKPSDSARRARRVRRAADRCRSQSRTRISGSVRHSPRATRISGPPGPSRRRTRGSAARRRPRLRRGARAGRRRRAADRPRATIACAWRVGMMSALSPSASASAATPTRVVTIGSRAAIASTSATPNPSYRLGATMMSASR